MPPTLAPDLDALLLRLRRKAGLDVARTGTGAASVIVSAVPTADRIIAGETAVRRARGREAATVWGRYAWGTAEPGRRAAQVAALVPRA